MSWFGTIRAIVRNKIFTVPSDISFEVERRIELGLRVEFELDWPKDEAFPTIDYPGWKKKDWNKVYGLQLK